VSFLAWLVLLQGNIGGIVGTAPPITPFRLFIFLLCPLSYLFVSGICLPARPSLVTEVLFLWRKNYRNKGIQHLRAKYMTVRGLWVLLLPTFVGEFYGSSDLLGRYTNLLDRSSTYSGIIVTAVQSIRHSAEADDIDPPTLALTRCVALLISLDILEDLADPNVPPGL